MICQNKDLYAVLVLGQPGEGKSKTINLLLQREVF